MVVSESDVQIAGRMWIAHAQCGRHASLATCSVPFDDNLHCGFYAAICLRVIFPGNTGGGQVSLLFGLRKVLEGSKAV
eukprot:3782974-Amphidinium_carterae.1